MGEPSILLLTTGENYCGLLKSRDLGAGSKRGNGGALHHFRFAPFRAGIRRQHLVKQLRLAKSRDFVVGEIEERRYLFAV